MPLRQTISLDDNWEFVRGHQSRHWLREAATRPDTILPHCWNEHDGFQEGVAYYRGPGSYRRTFRLEASAAIDRSRWFLESDGFYGTGDVWLNGRRLGLVDGRYLGFRLDATAALRFGAENVLGIRLTNRCGRNILPGLAMPDFLLYGGLSGSVRLVREPARRINPLALAIRCTELGDAGTQVTITWGLEGTAHAGDTVEWSLTGPDGNKAAPAQTSSVADQEQGMAIFTVTSPQHWNLEKPRLYQVAGLLRRDGQALDSIAQPFGIRTAEFRPRQGFFLNGRRVELRGCNRHESMPGFGRALPRWVHEADARLLKAMGLNFVRLSHYPQHPAFLDACDRLGILVYAELASWKSVRGGGWLRQARRQMEDMIRRDRNHPSVILWGMGNEGRHAVAYHCLYALCKALDPQRAVTYAENHFYRARRDKTRGIPDVWGLNYEFDAMEDGVAASRLQCAVVSECSNYPHTRRGDANAERIQLETLQADLARIADHPEVAGFALWCLNDYATLRKQRYRRFSGIVDGWRTPKAAARWLAQTYGDGRLARADRPGPDAGPGVSVALEAGEGSLTPDGDGTLEVLVRVLDAKGMQSAWSGELTACVTGPARVRAFDGRGTVWVADGIGRTFVSRTPGESGTVRLEVGSKGLETASLELGGRASSRAADNGNDEE